MTHLNIQQGLNIEVVSTLIIKKLYEAALSVPEPLSGEEDAAYMSGNLLTDRTYRTYVLYLTGRFSNLHINVTDSYYIPFEDSAVLNVLFANNIGSDGIGITEAEAANATLTNSTFFGNKDITSFNAFKYFTKANTNPPGLLFLGCSNLSSIDLSNVTTCSGSEFRNSGLSGEISLPNLTGNVAKHSFGGTNITSVTNLGTVTGISSDASGGGYGDGAFAYCMNLASVTIPSTVTAISGAFLGCRNLTTINGDLTNVTTLGNSSFDNTQISSLPNMPNVLTIGNNCFNECTLMTGVLNYPHLTSIGQYAFKGTKITSVTDLGSITSIPNNCFDSCTSLTSVTLPSTCTSIGRSSFINTTSLSNIDLSNAVTIGNNAFYGCNISGNLSLPNLTTVGENAFYGCNLGTVTLPNISSLTHRSFNNCGVTSFDISGSSITNIALLNLVTGDQLTSVKLPTTVTTFGSTYGRTFYSKNITELRGVLGITTVYEPNPNNILNPLPLLSLLTSDKFILAMDMSNGLVITASCPQAYLPVFKYCTKTTITKPTLPGYNNPESTFFLKYTNLKMPIRLLYFKDLEYIRPFMFYGANVTSLVINNTTCPTFNTTGMTYTNLLDTYMSDFTDWSTKPFGNMPIVTMTIYVPNNAVSTYQADSNYNSYTILGIGLLNSGVIYATEDDWVAANKPNGLIAEYLGLNTADLASFVSANNLTYWTNPNS